MHLSAALVPLALLILGCGFLPSLPSGASKSSAPVVPAGTPLAAGVSTQIKVSGSLDACGLTAPAPTTMELTAGPKNGPFDTYTLHQDPVAWADWDRRPAMDMMSLPAGSGIAKMASAEVGRAPAPTSAYGVAGGYEEAGEACDVHLYGVLVEPTTDGWQVTEVARRATVPPTPFDESDPNSNKACGLDREKLAEVEPCGMRITMVTGVTAPTSGGPLTGRKLLGAAGMARGMASWSETETLLVARLGPATRVEGAHHTWAVRDGETCVWFDVEKGWPAPILGDGSLDPAQLVGTVVEPYAAVDGAPYYTECMALTGS
ncbi:MAG: hypothetical protein Q8P41_17440 [Pseudomonadota bacterium]|nr:hypothetical protein [Pseudomonadota bacterium]